MLNKLLPAKHCENLVSLVGVYCCFQVAYIRYNLSHVVDSDEEETVESTTIYPPGGVFLYSYVPFFLLFLCVCLGGMCCKDR